MKFYDPRTKYILTGNEKYIQDEMCKSFYGSDYLNHAPTFAYWCETPLEETENQILKYETTKELFSANDVKTFRHYIFDMILHTHFEHHEGMMTNSINNGALVYTIDEDQIAKIRGELENTHQNDDENKIKRKEAKQKRDHKKQLFEKSLIERDDIERFLFNFDDILNDKSTKDASTTNANNDDDEIEDTTTESDSDENENENENNTTTK